MTRSEYLEMLRRNRLGDEYGNIMPSRPLPMPEEGLDYGRPLPMPEEGLDYGRPYRGWDGRRRRSYPEYRYGRDDYEQRLPYYPGRDAAPRQRTLEYDFDRDYDPYAYEELL